MIPSLLAIGIASVAVSSPQSKGSSPVFGATVDVVAIDVAVVDKDGEPMRGLGASDFTLTLDKKPRHVVSVDYVDDGPLAESEGVVEPPSVEYSTNQRDARGRLILLVVDQGNIAAGAGQEAMSAAASWLDRLNPEDRVGLVTIPGGGPRVEFTKDHSQVRSVLEKVVGRGRLAGRHVTLLEALAYDTQDDTERWQGAVQRECPTQDRGCLVQLEAEAGNVASQYRRVSTDSLAMLRATFDALKTIEGRKTMVLVTQGLGEPDSGSRVGLGYVSSIKDLSPAAAAARVSLFAVMASRESGLPDPMSDVPGGTLEDRILHEQGVDTLLESTHGAFLKGDPQDSFNRVARETSGYYLVGLEAEASDRNGRGHDLRVSVSRPGATVRARHSVSLAAAPSAKEIEQALASALRAPQPLAELPLRVATYALADAASGKVRIVISVEVAGGRVVPGLSVAYVLLDSKGKAAATASQRAAPSGDVVPSSLVTAAAVVPGLYTLRLAATDATRRMGRVDHAVKAALVDLAEPGLQASDLLLGPLPPKGASMRPGVALASGGAPLVADLELYSNEPGRLRDLTVTLELGNDDMSPALRSVPARIVAGPTPGRVLAQGVVGLEGLAPRGYVVRAVVARSGRIMGSLNRGFRVVPVADETVPAPVGN